MTEFDYDFTIPGIVSKIISFKESPADFVNRLEEFSGAVSAAADTVDALVDRHSEFRSWTTEALYEADIFAGLRDPNIGIIDYYGNLLKHWCDLSRLTSITSLVIDYDAAHNKLCSEVFDHVYRPTFYVIGETGHEFESESDENESDENESDENLADVIVRLAEETNYSHLATGAMEASTRIAVVTQAETGDRGEIHSDNDPRDEYIYEEWNNKTRSKDIMAHVNGKPEWHDIYTLPGLKSAARRYAMRKGLPLPKPRK